MREKGRKRQTRCVPRFVRKRGSRHTPPRNERRGAFGQIGRTTGARTRIADQEGEGAKGERRILRVVVPVPQESG